MTRLLQREMLDDLPAESAHAQASRDDLVRLNRWMGNAAIAARELRKIAGERRTLEIVDLGGGDGRFIARVAEILSTHGIRGHAIIVDQQSIVHPECISKFERLGWSWSTRTLDIAAWAAAAEPGPDGVLANLILHHFSDEELRSLFASMSRFVPALVAIEPRRSPVCSLLARLVWMVGCNFVTQHDARASVQAGFCGRELSGLWPAVADWQLKEYDAGFSSHVFTAQRV